MVKRKEEKGIRKRHSLSDRYTSISLATPTWTSYPEKRNGP